MAFERAGMPLLRLASSASQAEQFSLWAMRLWWRAFPELQAAWPDFLHGFRVCGVPAAVESCHRFCSVVLATGMCGVEIGCVHFPRILPAEERLLEALSAARDADASRVEAILREVVPPSAAHVATPLALRYAQILTGAGLSWQQPSMRDGAPLRREAVEVTGSLFSQRLH